MKRYFLLLLLVIVTAPTLVAAQAIPGLSQFQPSATITTSPRIPEPRDSVMVSLDAYTIDTSGAEITWWVEGNEVVDAKNQRSFTLIVGDLGETTTVDVRVRLSSGATVSASKTIRPSRVDLVLEANTLVPSFYQGRPLPSAGSVIRAVAIPQTGSNVSADEYVYLWKLENKVQFGGPLTGGNVAEIATGIGRNQTLSVDITDKQGNEIARKTIIIPLVEPELHFYVENPLRGLIPRSITSPLIMSSDEITVRAEPYYMDENILFINSLLEWSVNGRATDNQNSDPQNLTVRKTGGAGSAAIGFHIRNLSRLIQGVKGNFTVQY